MNLMIFLYSVIFYEFYEYSVTNAFNIDFKYLSVYSAHTKIMFYHIIKHIKIERVFPGARFTMIIEFILSYFMSEFVRRYIYIFMCEYACIIRMYNSILTSWLDHSTDI